VGIPIIVQDDFEVLRCHAYFIHHLLLVKQSSKQQHIKIQWILEYVEYCEACCNRTSPLWKSICRISLWSEAKVTIQNANIIIKMFSHRWRTVHTQPIECISLHKTLTDTWIFSLNVLSIPLYRKRGRTTIYRINLAIIFFCWESTLDIRRWVFTEWGTSHIVLEAWWTIFHICKPDGVNPWQLIDDMTRGRGAHNIREIIALTNHI